MIDKIKLFFQNIIAMYQNNIWLEQMIDQSLHISMGIASVWLISTIFNNLWIGVILTVAWEGYREYKQWTSHIWWDPYLDWTFEIVGIILGIYLYIKFGKG